MEKPRKLTGPQLNNDWKMNFDFELATFLVFFGGVTVGEAPKGWEFHGHTWRAQITVGLTVGRGWVDGRPFYHLGIRN